MVRRSCILKRQLATIRSGAYMFRKQEDDMHPDDQKRLDREASIKHATRGPDYSTENELYRRRMEELSKRKASQAELDNRRRSAIAEGREQEF